MILTLTILNAVIGLFYSIKSQKIFNKGLSEADSYRMVMEFNKSKRMRKQSTIFLILAMLLFTIYIIQLLTMYNTK